MFSKTLNNEKAIQRIQADRAKSVREIKVLQRSDSAAAWKLYKVAMSAAEAMSYCDELWESGLQAKTKEV